MRYRRYRGAAKQDAVENAAATRYARRVRYRRRSPARRVGARREIGRRLRIRVSRRISARAIDGDGKAEDWLTTDRRESRCIALHTVRSREVTARLPRRQVTSDHASLVFRIQQAGRGGLPADSLHAGDVIKVPIPAEQRQAVLARQRCDPQVVGRYRTSGVL